MTAVPADHTYVLVQNSGAERVLLVDLAAKRSTEVVRFERELTSRRSVALTESADGRALAILERIDASVLLHVVRPITGEVRTLPQPADVDTAAISPDGTRVAIARVSTDFAANGLWLAAVDGSAPARLVGLRSDRTGPPPRPRAWSPDGRWLAVSASIGTDLNEIVVVDTTAGETIFDPSLNSFSGGDARLVEAANDAEWSAGGLIFWTSRGPFGAPPTVSSYDLIAGSTTELYEAKADQSILDARLRPGTRQIAVLQAPFAATLTTPRAIVLVERGVTPRALRDVGFGARMWWSPDGARLDVRTGDDSTGTITDVFGTWGTMAFCLRGGDAPPCL
ncbi:MAG TPA: hypothetical protein VGQ86_07105 [Candidatus Limnocylindria bacterium]|nr:hypothetical protein [Candidatus Limnocylindria bacterium]